MINPDAPAFPIPSCHSTDGYEHYTSPQEPGLTIRQEFAARAMQGMLSQDEWSDEFPYAEKLAVKAVRYADALIAELNKEQTR